MDLNFRSECSLSKLHWITLNRNSLRILICVKLLHRTLVLTWRSICVGLHAYTHLALHEDAMLECTTVIPNSLTLRYNKIRLTPSLTGKLQCHRRWICWNMMSNLCGVCYGRTETIQLNHLLHGVVYYTDTTANYIGLPKLRIYPVRIYSLYRLST